MTVDEIFAPSSGGKNYSIQDVLSAVGSQYQPSQASTPQRTQSIDEILAGLTGAPQFKSGAAQYIPNTPIETQTQYTPGNFDLTEYQLKYANQMIANGVPAQQAIEEAGLGSKIGSMAGAYYGNTLIPVVGGMFGSAIGGALGGIFDDFF